MEDSKKPSRIIEASPQPEMFSDLPPPGRKKAPFTKGFVRPDPELLFVGHQRLKDFLVHAGLDLPLQIREMVNEVDFTVFESKYEMNGRAPYHPAIIMGLVIYGIIKNQGSLRQLEVLARADLGAHWITGGVMPDHSTIGRFLEIHTDAITTDFFENLTRGLLKRVGQPTTEWAIDGTVVESAANRFRTLKLDAAKEIMAEFDGQKPSEDSTEPPDDDLPPSMGESSNNPTLGKKTRSTLKPDKLKRAIETGETNVERRRVNGADPKKVQVCTTDPEAMILLTKQGVYRPAYMASFATTCFRMIIGYALHQYSETQPVDDLLSQATRVAGPPENVLMDTGYHTVAIAQTAENHGAYLICPPKPSTLKRTSKKAFFSKHLDFQYLPDDDAYRCPAGETLNFKSIRNDKRRGTSGRIYCTKPSICQSCPLRDQCTPKHRRIMRSADEHLLENLRRIHAIPENQALYSKRLGSVEPVIGALKSNQGLTRFSRFGKRSTTLELCLHACAHNVKRAAALVRFWLVLRVLEAIVEARRLSISFQQRFLQNGAQLTF